jgi:hypothetical protein
MFMLKTIFQYIFKLKTLLKYIFHHITKHILFIIIITKKLSIKYKV